MKLFFYINTLSHGGAERVVANLSQEMANRGHDCTVVLSTPSDWEYSINVNVKRIYLFDNRIAGFLKRNLRLVTALRRIIKREKPDLLVTFMGEPNLRALPVVWGLKTKVVMSVRNDPRIEYSGLLYRFIAKHFFKYASGMVFQTENAKVWFPKSLQEKSQIIFNPISESFYHVSLTKNRKGIVTTGRLEAQKNQKVLIEAYSKIVSKVEDDLIIYGTGSLEEELKSLAKSLGVDHRVHFAGQCDNVPYALSHAKLYVLSSDYEGLPNGLMEAMAVGLPCISTDCPCGGPRMLFTEILEDCLVPIRDASALATKMYNLLSNEELLILYAEKCKDLSNAFSSTKVYNQWEDYLQRVLF